MEATEVRIRRAETLADYRACEDLQRRAWAMPGDLEIVPLHVLVTAQHNGGMVLLAEDGERAVGCLFGFLGRGVGGNKLCSHLMAVAPEMQGRGIGYRLKQAQREAALAEGIELITWTYDPLESRNARLNVHRLGAVCRTYFRDLYGPLADGLNAGLPTDRFEVEWWLNSERVIAHLTGARYEPEIAGAPAALWGVPRPDGALVPRAGDLASQDTAVVVEVPAKFQALKAADPGLALTWRIATRQVFEALFASGYTVIDFGGRELDTGRRGFYLLTRPVT